MIIEGTVRRAVTSGSRASRSAQSLVSLAYGVVARDFTRSAANVYSLITAFCARQTLHRILLRVSYVLRVSVRDKVNEL